MNQSLDKIEHIFKTKTFKKLDIEGNIFNLISHQKHLFIVRKLGILPQEQN